MFKSNNEIRLTISNEPIAVLDEPFDRRAC
jgi:hypothetical protein